MKTAIRGIIGVYNVSPFLLLRGYCKQVDLSIIHGSLTKLVQSRGLDVSQVLSCVYLFLIYRYGKKPYFLAGHSE